jgi:hypothetical protein
MTYSAFFERDGPWAKLARVFARLRKALGENAATRKQTGLSFDKGSYWKLPFIPLRGMKQGHVLCFVVHPKGSALGGGHQAKA